MVDIGTVMQLCRELVMCRCSQLELKNVHIYLEFLSMIYDATGRDIWKQIKMYIWYRRSKFRVNVIIIENNSYNPSFGRVPLCSHALYVDLGTLRPESQLFANDIPNHCLLGLPFQAESLVCGGGIDPPSSLKWRFQFASQGGILGLDKVGGLLPGEGWCREEELLSRLDRNLERFHMGICHVLNVDPGGGDPGLLREERLPE